MLTATHFAGMLVPKCHQDLEAVLNAGIDRVILTGPPGTGKTYSGLTVGLTIGKPSFRLVCTEDMTTADVSGMFMPSADGGFTWHDGAATKAWRTGGRLVIDEIDKASGDVFALLLAYTDSVGSASIDLLNGETIRPAAGFSVVMTSNIEDSNELPPALRDRFPISITIDQAHPAALMSIRAEFRELAMKLVSAPMGERASLRAFYAFEQLLTGGFEVISAANLVFGKFIAESIVDAVKIGKLSTEMPMSTESVFTTGL